ncbi:hypothetical protein, partial [Arcanobacterium phocae]|uniref:hypothetical protein n=1 Tax=Arcanobacterium phocae TaxID=131112 RepID=UPI001C12526F
DPSSSGEMRLFALVSVFLAVGLGIFSLVLLAAPLSFRRDSSFKSLAIALFFVVVAVLVKACA